MPDLPSWSGESHCLGTARCPWLSPRSGTQLRRPASCLRISAALGGTRTPNLLIRRNLQGPRSPAEAALACRNGCQSCALTVVLKRTHTARIRPGGASDAASWDRSNDVKPALTVNSPDTSRAVTTRSSACKLRSRCRLPSLVWGLTSSLSASVGHCPASLWSGVGVKSARTSAAGFRGCWQLLLS
jgi:hypothetical protein